MVTTLELYSSEMEFRFEPNLYTTLMKLIMEWQFGVLMFLLEFSSVNAFSSVLLTKADLFDTTFWP